MPVDVGGDGSQLEGRLFPVVSVLSSIMTLRTIPSCRRTGMRLALLLALTPVALHGQSRPLTSADSALVGRILLAEDTRNATDPALALGAGHADARIRALAVRAGERITDPVFARRDSLQALPALPSPPVYPEPAWRLRYRALTAQRNDCAALHAALSDSAWPVRLRAAGLLGAPCASHDPIAAELRRWIGELPADASHRRAGAVSWHAATHALTALARMNTSDAASHVTRLATHAQPEVRQYAARAAAQLGDTARLRSFARDGDANVRSLAIDALRRLSGHADDALYLDALADSMAQVVRSAALALAGSTHAGLADRVAPVYTRWAQRASASERDVRVALLAAMGGDTARERIPAPEAVLPPRAVALALGDTVHIRVVMADASGGGAFVVRLRGDVAPMMAARILELAERGYYDGLTWHRVEHDFVIQGGSPGANEYVGLDRYLRDELGTVPHLRGTVGMSTRGHDTGDAQWFVNLRDNARLTRDYTVFAEVVSGIDVVDGVLEGDVIASMRVEPARR